VFDSTPTCQPLTKQEAEQRQRYYTAQSFMRSQGPRYASCRLGNFEVTTDQQRIVVDSLKQYLADFPRGVESGTGIVLYGPSGTGKDHLAIALGGEALYRHAKIHPLDIGKDDPRLEPYEILRVRGSDLFQRVRGTMHEDSTITEAEIVEELTTPDILIVSDPLPQQGPLTPFQADVLFRVIDFRYSWRRPTWTTLNVCNGAEADERLGAAIADRLRDGALCLHCNWPSYRRSQKAEAKQ